MIEVVPVPQSMTASLFCRTCLDCETVSFTAETTQDVDWVCRCGGSKIHIPADIVSRWNKLAHQTPPATQPIATVGEVERLANNLLSLEITPISDEHAGAKNGKELIRAHSIGRSLLATLHTPPPVATATVDAGDWALPDLRDAHNDVERIRDHDLGNSRMSELLRGAMDMLRAADVEYAMYGATPTPPAGGQ